MSDPTTIDEATIDPAIKTFFEAKYTPLVDKNKELLGKVGNYRALDDELKALGGLDAIKALRKQATEAEATAERERLAALTKDGKLNEVEEHYKKQLAERDTKLTAFQQRLVNREIDSQLAEAIGDQGSPILLTPHMRSRIEGSLDEHGDVQLTVKGSAGQTITLDELVAEFKAKPEFAGAWKAHQANGGGSRGNRAAASNNPFAKATANVTAQMKLIKEQPEVARRLATEAGEPVDW